MIIITYIIFSFLLDSISTNYLSFEINNLSYLKTIYTIISLIVSYQYFKNEKKYLILIIITSIIFDIRYTNTFILNPTIFIIIYILNLIINNHFQNNIITINLKSIISIIVYNIMTYVILILSNYNIYKLNILYNIIIRNIPMTIIYTTITYLLLKKINPKLIK